MLTTFHLLNNIRNIFKKNKIASAQAEAEILLGHFTKLGRADFFLKDQPVSSVTQKKIEKALKRRIKREPLQHILGEAWFYGHRFITTKDALIPRPETEILVSETLSVLAKSQERGVTAVGVRLENTEGGFRADNRRQDPEPEILDLGTGSGCVAVSLTLALPDCRMTALDKSQKALNLARKNARLHGVGKQIHFQKSDLFSSIKPGAQWDVIVSNPPYIPKKELNGLSPEVKCDPRLALDGGKNGLQIIEKILDEAPRYLKKGGFLLMEIGAGQSKALRKILKDSSNYKNLEFIKDFNGIERVLKIQHG